MDEEVPICFSRLKELILKNEFFRFDLRFKVKSKVFKSPSTVTLLVAFLLILYLVCLLDNLIFLHYFLS
jgi:hypothetical protein